ncbi:helix-turn-helix transcriptional regulator [Tsukamurella conjunctivitidis]|nr:helix-turn-helix domain-containing protein [Tsukamurella conjunctivitidis]
MNIPPRPTDDRLLRYEEVARLLNCSRRYVQDLVNDGELITVKLGKGGVKLFRASDIQNYIRHLPEAS